ncbi:hypothetical protein [Anabaena sp. UHCC 0451]|uniref:hypothetical protein n=1 Tax=Anabaena sp. UHCC 0451 TaxID=2055235 RepID=UPI002B200ED5|nr:hypothetical protein [Anabaena sp. UHCC 0451]MEA5576242.1 hypothetical protein [Anabaena sp. UHCC 0451]
MFGFIKNLIGGIFGFIGGLFGKKDEYYLELKEEAGDTKPAPAEAKSVATAAKVEPIKPAAAKVEPAKVSKPTPAKPTEATETNFATKYLMTESSAGRRRPGANMNSFLDMASQVKVPG